MLAVFASARAADSVSGIETARVITNLAEIRRLASSGGAVMRSVQLEGVVCWADSAKGRFILQSEAGAINIELGAAAQPAHPGDKVLVAGKCAIGSTGLSAGILPLVDNDGTHAMLENAGNIFLKAGKHPIRVDWFNAGGEFGLEVFYQGPGLPRQRIPALALWRKQGDGTNRLPTLVNGLNYRYYEGNWSRLPNFGELKPVKTGVVGNFDPTVKERTDNIGIEFTGLVETPKDGLYTFSTKSDDGSRLFIGEPSLRLEVLGAGPLPVPRRIALGQTLGREERPWAEVEGTITFVSELPDGLSLELKAGSALMRAIVTDGSRLVPSLLLNSRIRAWGICQSVYTGEGQGSAGVLAVPSWREIEPLELSPELWTGQPVTPAGVLSTFKSSGAPERVVHVAGRIRSVDPGSALVIEDGTGEIVVETTRSPPGMAGLKVEALGRWTRVGTKMVLQGGFYRRADEPVDAKSESLTLLTTAEQVQRLNPKEAARRYPVTIRGVVTGQIPVGPGIVIQDSTRGIYVDCSALGGFIPLEPGEFCEIEGATDPGDFAPIVKAQRAFWLEVGRLPEVVHPTLDELNNGSLDCQYVELRGIVTALPGDGVRLFMRVGKIRVHLEGIEPDSLKKYQDALIRVRGCLAADFDAVTHQVNSGEIHIYNPLVNVDEPAPADLFGTPGKHAAELRQFDSQADALQRVKVSGQVIYGRNGEYFLMDGTNGLRFIPRQSLQLKAGDLVEAVGFPQLGGVSPALREAVARKTGHSPLPAGKKLSAGSLLSASQDATLVDIESQLVGLRFQGAEQVLELQAGLRTYLARLNTNDGIWHSAALGSRLKLSGVYAGLGGDRAEGRELDSFELLLNAPSDITTLSRPSWWTAGHALGVVGALLGVLAVAAAWVKGLRGQVEQRTGQLQLEIEERKLTEVELAHERELLRSLLDKSPDHIYFKDRDSRYIRCSKSQCELFGINQLEIIGRKDFDFFAEEHARAAFEDEREIIRSGRPLLAKIEREYLKDGRELWALTSKMPLRSQAGEIIGTFDISKDITAMKQAEAKLAETHRQLLETSRLAGMAEVATSVLHNVGNVLNSVNISGSLVAEKVRHSKVAGLARVVALLQEHAGDLPGFLSADPKGRQLPGYLAQLSGHLAAEQQELLRELASLGANIEHIKEIVAMQQSHARVGGVRETLGAAELVEDALRLNAGSMERHQVRVVREYGPAPPVVVERHKVLQILVNLLCNAKHALDERGPGDTRLTLRVGNNGVGRVKISVTDNGVGIAAENLSRIFGHGFTTRKEGHGFGLHSSALAARRLGGSLARRATDPAWAPPSRSNSPPSRATPKGHRKTPPAEASWVFRAYC